MTRSNQTTTGPWALIWLSELTRVSVERPSKGELDQGLAALHARIANRRILRRQLARTSLIGILAVISCVVAVQLARLAIRDMAVAEPKLAYQVDGGSVLEGGYLRGSGRDGIKLSFNEGSRIELTPGSRGRLRAIDKEGARVAIENGTALFQITPSHSRRWLVEVGPFLVTVKGTAFSVSWEPTSERFELNLREGRVTVSGPVSAGDFALRAGQRLVVTLPRAEAVITEQEPEQLSKQEPVDPVPSNEDPAPAASLERMTAAEPSALPSLTAPVTSSVSKDSPGRRWRDDLVNGKWDEILEHAERRGVETTLNEATSDELFALADAARYRRRTDLARLALLAVRRRFPTSSRALDASFLLGRIEESRGSSSARAIEWYDQYLGQAPTGPYAAEALGRKMTLTKQLRGSAQAQLLAEEYLRLFPNGSYAGSARALLHAP